MDIIFPTFERVGRNPRAFKVGLINREGHRVAQPIYDDARPLCDGLLPVRIRQRWGAVTADGNLRIEPCSELPLRVSEKRIVFGDQGLRGILDVDGNVILPPTYKKMGEFREGLAWTANNRGYGFVRDDGTELLPGFYDDANSFSEGLAPVRLGNRWGFIDKELNLTISFQFDFALPFSEGLARVKINDAWGYIDRSGKLAIQPIYIHAREYSEGLAEVMLDSRWGYIDRSGKIKINCTFRYSDLFQAGLASAGPYDDPKKYIGFIDCKGAFVIAPQFLMVGRFRHGLCFVEMDDSVAYIDTHGRQIWSSPYVEIPKIWEL